MNKPNFHETANTILSVIAIAVSGLSFWFSYYTYSQSKKEIVAISSTMIIKDYPIKIYKINNKIIVPIYKNIIISNNSDKAVSIIDVGAELKHPYSKTVYYSGLFNGFYTNYDQSIGLPINLSSGESKNYLIKVGVLCDSITSRNIEKEMKLSIRDNFKQKIDTRFFSILNIFFKYKREFTGNRIEGEIINKQEANFDLQPENQQQIILSATTSNGTVIKHNITPF